MKSLPIVVLISGTGSNLRALHAAITAGQCQAEIRAVISDRRRASGLEYAQAAGLQTRVVPLNAFETRADWDQALADTVQGFAPELVVAAGFMRILGEAFVERYRHRTLNVHPALLPLFPGLHAPEQALRAGVALSGCTVHIVDSGVDTGPIVAQAAVRVHTDDTPERLHARIQTAEHALLPRVVDAVARDQVQLGPRPTVHFPVTACGGPYFSLPDPPA